MTDRENSPERLVVRLLGPPALLRAGRECPPPRGAKAWGLLAHLVLTDAPSRRRQLAGLLFPDADDPLGALRWSLAELRRALGIPEALRGDPVALAPSPDREVDVLSLLAGELPAAADDGDGELLEGMSFATSPGFESWLLVERRRLAGAREALLHDAALAGLAAGRLAEARGLAARLVALEPLQEVHHELLVRCLALGGDREGALAHVARADALLRSELGVPASPALARAARAADPVPSRSPAGGRGAALGHLEAGKAAAAAGAVEPALERLRQACTGAAVSGDHALRARALVALGTTLVHTCRGRDEEGAAVLHQAIAVAERAGARAEGVAALRELGYVSVQAGRRDRAEDWLARAEEMARGDAELAAVRGVQGMNHSDRADYPAALAHLVESVDRAEAVGDRRLAAWSLSLVGRVHLLRGDDAEAVAAIDRCLEMVGAEHWIAFLPWPEALRAELELRAGDVDGAAGRLEHAFTLACEIEDTCWEGVSARAIGLLESGRGRAEEGRRWLEDALVRCTRVPDRYEWAHGYVLEALVDEAVRAGDPGAQEAAQRLHALAARTGMRELVVRAQVHLHRLGAPGALDSALLLAREIDNPRLGALLAAHTPAHTPAAQAPPTPREGGSP